MSRDGSTMPERDATLAILTPHTDHARLFQADGAAGDRAGEGHQRGVERLVFQLTIGISVVFLLLAIVASVLVPRFAEI